jgi:WS/DGAT/MGAT family acyltransferase
MQQLTNLDASFLHLESARTPMHIGCVLKFSKPKNGVMSFERFKNYIESRLSISPVFRRTLKTIPFDLDRPYWVDDVNFNINNHLTQLKLFGKNIANQRTDVINTFFSETLSPSKPLWEMLFIQDSGQQNDGFSVLLKIHHAAADGKSAETILSGLLSDNPEQSQHVKESWVPKKLSKRKMADNKLRSVYRSPRELLSLTKRLGQSVSNSQLLRLLDRQECPPNFFTAPSTPFNKEVGSAHALNSAHLSLAAIKEIKTAYPGSTINDVVLTLCASALRKHLLSKNALPIKPISAMVPVSKRPEGGQNGGNLISPMLVSLATNIGSPIERLATIHQNAQIAKKYNKEVAVERIINHLPSWSSSWVTKAYTRLRVANKFNPIFNVIITNVPGPRCQMYLDGAKLMSLEGTAPIVDGMGLTLVVTSYMQALTIGMTSTAKMAPHGSEFIQYLHESLDELHHALIPQKLDKAS